MMTRCNTLQHAATRCNTEYDTIRRHFNKGTKKSVPFMMSDHYDCSLFTCVVLIYGFLLLVSFLKSVLFMVSDHFDS